MKNLKFLNHASYFLESDKSILLFDPWYEKGAFNNGWQLYYQNTKNKEVIEYLVNSEKFVYIWLSHEHSDHFNISFIKTLKIYNLKVIFLFHQTIDKRVINFLKKNNFKVLECKNGKVIKIDSMITIITYRYSRLDSLCLTSFGEINILNINDCVIKNQSQAKKVFSQFPVRKKNIDILFTQFGYADWVGRKIDIDYRKNCAIEKLERIYNQDQVFKPKIIIPFASFMFFSKEDNHYMNYEQNGIREIRESKILSTIQQKINFLKPNQLIEFKQNYRKEIIRNSKEAEYFWGNLIKEVKVKKFKLFIPETVEFEKIIQIGNEYISKTNKETFFISYLSELLNKLNIKSLLIHIYDIKKSFSLSYVNGFKKIDNMSLKNYDISIHSNEIYFILKNEFGWNTINVSGAVRVNSNNLKKLTSFFLWQDAIKNGFSYKNPFYTFFIIFRYLCKKLTNKLIWIFEIFP